MTTIVFYKGVLAMDSAVTSTFYMDREAVCVEQNLNFQKFRIFPELNTIVCCTGQAETLHTSDIAMLAKDGHIQSTRKYKVKESYLTYDHLSNAQSNILVINWAKKTTRCYKRSVKQTANFWSNMIGVTINLSETDSDSYKDRPLLLTAGSGGWIAREALDIAKANNLKVDAVDLVKVAAQHDKFSGGTVKFIDLSKQEINHARPISKDQNIIIKSSQIKY